MSKVIEHKRYVCVESSYGQQGHNKFWQYTVYDDGSLKTEWGRVENTSQTQTKNLGSVDRALAEGRKQAAKKQKGKKGKGGADSVYTEVDLAAANDIDIPTASKNSSVSGAVLRQAAKEIAKGDKIIEKLVDRFVKQNAHQITSNTKIQYNEATGLFSTALGVVSRTTVDDARGILSKLATFVENNDLENKNAIPILDSYLRLIPQGTGRNRPTLELLVPTIAKIDEQNSILDSLQGSLDILEKGPEPKAAKEEKGRIWDIDLSLNEERAVFREVNDLYNKTRQRVHTSYGLKPKRVFSVTHKAMQRGWEKDGSKMSNIWRLWHGTRVGNILSILAKGMIIPPSSAGHCTGRLYGDGLYFSDQSTKSLNYAQGYWGGGSYDNNCFMFLCDVAMGKHYTPSRMRCVKPPKGYDSVFAKGGQSGVMNNEMIVYRATQANMAYLIEFSDH